MYGVHVACSCTVQYIQSVLCTLYRVSVPMAVLWGPLADTQPNHPDWLTRRTNTTDYTQSTDTLRANTTGPIPRLSGKTHSLVLIKPRRSQVSAGGKRGRACRSPQSGLDHLSVPQAGGSVSGLVASRLVIPWCLYGQWFLPCRYL